MADKCKLSCPPMRRLIVLEQHLPVTNGDCIPSRNPVSRSDEDDGIWEGKVERHRCILAIPNTSAAGWYVVLHLVSAEGTWQEGGTRNTGTLRLVAHKYIMDTATIHAGDPVEHQVFLLHKTAGPPFVMDGLVSAKSLCDCLT
ncbi:hypothetical protein CBL_06990 [Carabus blaptoides fortunei]